MDVQVIPMLRDASARNKPVAVITDLRDRHGEGYQYRRPILEDLAEVGTTAEIVAFREEEESAHIYVPSIVVKFLGRQRFRLIELHRKINGCVVFFINLSVKKINFLI